MIIRLADCPVQPWKNGLGRTCVMAVAPPGAGADDFIWRVSVAEVDSAAPFSRFPGIDRHIVLLDGAGFMMTLDAAATHALTTPFEPFAFAGEAAVEVTLAGGATRDFNLMVRRTLARSNLAVWHGAATHEADPSLTLLFCAHGTIDTCAGSLKAGDAWLPSAPGHHPVTLHDDAVALVVRIEPIAR